MRVMHGIAVKEAGPVAGRHFEEVIDSGGQQSGGIPVLTHLRQEVCIGPADFVGTLAGVVGQQVGGLVHPGVGRLDVRPQRGGRLQAPREQGVQAGQDAGEPLFSATRSIDA